MPKLKSKQELGIYNGHATSSSSSSYECKSMPCSSFMKLRGTDKVYQEALEAASKFNKRLFLDRKTRIPFIDSQTRVAQSNCLLWYFEYQREEGIRQSEQIYSYPLKSWIKKRRLNYDLDSTMLRNHQFDVNQLNNENSNSADSIQHSHKNPLLLNEHQNDHQNTLSLNCNNNKTITSEDWQHSTQEDSFDYYNDDNNESDFDDFEDKRKKTRRGRGVGKGGRRSVVDVDEKPFECEKCGAKYKTKPGLTYHFHKTHTKGSNQLIQHASSHSNHSSDDHRGATHNDENTNSNAYDEHDPLKLLIHSNSKLCASCGYGSIAEDSKRQVDQLISCCECPRLFHPVCLNFTANMISSVKKYKWQCIECKKCVICGNSENDDKLLFCDDCDRGYHMYCLSPPINEAPEGDWNCELCVKEFGNQ